MVAADDVVTLLTKVLSLSTTLAETKVYIVTALAKLSVRFSPAHQNRIQIVISSCLNSHNIDLQQRASEFSQFGSWEESKRAALLKRIPPLPPKTSDTLSNGNSNSNFSPISTQVFTPPKIQENSLIGNLLGPIDQNTNTGNTGNALDPGLLKFLGVTPTPGAPVPNTPLSDNAANDILNLFGPTTHSPGLGVGPMPYGVPGGSTMLPGVSGLTGFSGVNFSTPPVGIPGFGLPPSDPQFPPIVAFTTPEFSCTFYFKKPNPQQPQYTIITAVFTCTHPSAVTDFNFQAAPPKHLKYILEFPTGKDMMSLGSSITQVIKAVNSAQGDKPLMMKVRVTYSCEGQKRDTEYVIKNFPANL